MTDDFLRAIVPDWDTLTDEEKARYRGQLDDMLDGPCNPLKGKAADTEPASQHQEP